MALSCDTIVSSLGYECIPVSESVYRLVSPFTIGEDGELAGVYVHDLGGERYRVSDECDSLIHARMHNVSLKGKRLSLIAEMAGSQGVLLSENGELYSSADRGSLPWAISRVLNVSLGVGHMEQEWQTKPQSITFKGIVSDFLNSTYKGVERNVEVHGLSGHQIVIPFVVPGERPSYVQTVGRSRDKMNWGKVYETAGVMSDLRELDAKRIVIVDDHNDIDTQQAESILAERAVVLPFSLRAKWYQSLAA